MKDVSVTFSDGDSETAQLAQAILEAFATEGIKIDAKASPPDWWPAISGHALVVVGDKT
jgi:hypothetical protein